MKFGGNNGFLGLFFLRMWIFGLKMGAGVLMYMVWARQDKSNAQVLKKSVQK